MPWDAHKKADKADDGTSPLGMGTVGAALEAASGPPAPEDELTVEERIEWVAASCPCTRTRTHATLAHHCVDRPDLVA